MKRTIYLFSLLLSIITSYAQDSPFIIKGQTDTLLPYLVLIHESENGILSIQDTIQISHDRKFNRTIRVNQSGKAFIKCGDEVYALWLMPGQSLTIDLKNENALFTGSAGIFAKYYVDHQNFFKKIYKDSENKHPGFNKESSLFSDKYFSVLDSITIQRLDFLNNYFIHSNLKNKQAFVKQESTSLIYSNLYYKTAFEGSKPKNFKFYQDKYKIKSPRFYAFSDMVNFENYKLLSNPDFRKFAVSFVQNLTSQQLKERSVKFEIRPYIDLAMIAIDELAAEVNTANELKVIFLNNIIDEIERDKKVEWAKKIDSTLSNLQLSRKSQSVSFAIEKLHKLLLNSSFDRGSPAPEFALTDQSGKIYTLKDFRGKRIYIDLGASWCKPCIESIPSWNKLVEELESGNNVLFISLSLDDTKEMWQKYTKKYTVKGMQLYAGSGGFKSSFAINYGVKSIPRFILIDEEGKVLQFSAPTPDSNEIKNLLQ